MLLVVAVGVANINACSSMEFGHDHDVQLLFPFSRMPCRQRLQEPPPWPIIEEIPDLSQNFLRGYHSNEHYPNYSYFLKQQGNTGCVFKFSIFSASPKTNYSWCPGWIKSADGWWLKNQPCTIRSTKRPVLASSDVVERSVPTVFDTPVVACRHVMYSVNHLYISIYFCLKTNSPSQCLATKLKDKCMRSSAASMHTPRHAAVPNMNELCCRYQSQKRGSIKNVQQQKLSRSHNVVC